MKKLLSVITVMLFSIVAFSQTKLSTTTKLPVLGTLKVSKELKPLKAIAPIPENKSFNLDIKVPKTQEENLKNAVPTSNTATFKSQNYPVYATTKGKLFIVIPNTKDNGYHKKYITDNL